MQSFLSSNQKSLEQFFDQEKIISYTKGEVILRPDEPWHYIYLIVSGYVRQYAVSEDGDEFTLNIYRPHSYFAVNLALHSEVNKYYFEALTPLKVKKLPTAQVVQFINHNPDAMFDLLKRLSSGLNGMSSRLESLIFGTAREKVAATLFLNALRFGKKNSEKTLIDFPLTHRQIATMTGVTRETVSIEMMKLKKAGIIFYKGKVVGINDIERLQEASSLSQYR